MAMDLKTRILVAVVPFLFAGAIGFSLAYPAYNEYATKATAVSEKEAEAADLDSKLVNRNKVAKEKKDLDSAIASLRDSVPKRPDLELLNLDIEKMALESGLEVVAFKEADKDMKKRAGVEEDPAGTNMTRGKEKLADRVKTTVGAAGAAAAGAGAAVAGAAGAAAGQPGAKPAKASAPPDAGLLKTLLQVKLVGDYKSLMSFIHKLETYQRVVAINEVKTMIPKVTKGKEKSQGAELPDETEPGEDDPLGNPNVLVISLGLTAYYLP